MAPFSASVQSPMRSDVAVWNVIVPPRLAIFVYIVMNVGSASFVDDSELFSSPQRAPSFSRQKSIIDNVNARSVPVVVTYGNGEKSTSDVVCFHTWWALMACL